MGRARNRKLVPEGPIEFLASIEIARPAALVYPLIDWADPRNAKRALGGRIVETDAEAGRFELTLAGLADYVFEIAVGEAVPCQAYAFASEIAPPIGRLVRSHERYTFEPLGEHSCRLALVNTAEFVGGMSLGEFREELLMMTGATHNALEKLKLHAEEGVASVRALEERCLPL